MKIGQKSGIAKSIIIVLLIIAVTVGITYAYFTLQITGTPSDINLGTGTFDVNFTTSKYISMINANLTDDKYEGGATTLFSVSLANSSLDTVDYYISLDEVVMSTSLYSKYFHYELVQYTGVELPAITIKSECESEGGFWDVDSICYTLSNEITLASKHFGICDSEDVINYNETECNEFQTSNKIRLNTSSISLTRTDKHFLGVRLWLENDSLANQNNLMESNFSSKISVLARQS